MSNNPAEAAKKLQVFEPLIDRRAGALLEEAKAIYLLKASQRGMKPADPVMTASEREASQLVVESIGDSPAVLLKNHGVFTIGKNAAAAVKAAVMTEDVAASVWLALQLGTPDEIPADDVARLHDRYKNVYGQR